MEIFNFLVVLNHNNMIEYIVLLESLVHTNNHKNMVIYIIGEKQNLQCYNILDCFFQNHELNYIYFQHRAGKRSGLDYLIDTISNSAHILPADVKKIIYLSSNIIIKGNIDQLWYYDIGDYFFAACEDRNISRGVDLEELKRVGMSEKDVYFNTDVLILNIIELKKCAFEISEGVYNFGLKSYINSNLVSKVREIRDKKYNTQLLSYIKRERESKFNEAVVLNYENIEISECEEKDIYEGLYKLWWKYAESYDFDKENILRRKKLEKRRKLLDKLGFSIDYLRFVFQKLCDNQINLDINNIIVLLKRSDLWDPFYFLNKNYFTYQKKYYKLINGYKSVQVHCLSGGGAAMFFLSVICYKIMCTSNNSFHIFIPVTMLADSPADNPDFYVHNEYVLKYMEHAFIPRRKEKDFLKFILTKFFYQLDFSMFGKFSPVLYENNGGDYSELDHIQVIKFSDNEIRRGEDFLKKNGIKGKLVCIAPRNNEYKKMYMKSVSPNDYLVHRNGSIDSYIKAVNMIQSFNYSLIQMGKVNKLSFPKECGILNFSKVYDEFLDLFLYSKCEFVIGDSSGLMNISNMFSKPTVQANWELVTTAKEITGYLKEGKDIILPVKYWNEENGSYLTLSEQLSLEVKYKEKRFEEEILRLGYVGISNTPEEIELAAKEMLENIIGKKEYTEEEIHLQNISKRLILGSASKYGMRYPRCNIAVGFLKLNKWYLGI